MNNTIGLMAINHSIENEVYLFSTWFACLCPICNSYIYEGDPTSSYGNFYAICSKCEYIGICLSSMKLVKYKPKYLEDSEHDSEKEDSEQSDSEKEDSEQADSEKEDSEQAEDTPIDLISTLNLTETYNKLTSHPKYLEAIDKMTDEDEEFTHFYTFHIVKFKHLLHEWYDDDVDIQTHINRDSKLYTNIDRYSLTFNEATSGCVVMCSIICNCTDELCLFRIGYD
jgi:hypothetical protein